MSKKHRVIPSFEEWVHEEHDNVEINVIKKDDVIMKALDVPPGKINIPVALNPLSQALNNITIN